MIFCQATALTVGVIFGAKLVQHFIGRYSRYSRYQTVLLKLEEIISTFGRIQKNAPFFGAFFIISSMNRGANHDCLAANYQFRLASPSYDVPLAQFGVKMAIIS